MDTDRTEHWRRLERMYAGAAINRFFAPTIEVGDGEAAVTMVVRPDFHHAAHAAHGAVYFKALDDAAFFAANSVVDGVFVLTVRFTVELLKPVRDGTIIARGRVTDRGTRSLVAESALTDAAGTTIARGSGKFVMSRIPLDERVGYGPATTPGA